MAEMFGFLIIGCFIGGITMAIVYVIVDKYDDTDDQNNRGLDIHIEFPDIKEIPPEVCEWLRRYYWKDKDKK